MNMSVRGVCRGGCSKAAGLPASDSASDLMMTSLTASSCATDMDTVVCRRSSGSMPSVHRTTCGFARNASVICKNTAVRVSP